MIINYKEPYWMKFRWDMSSHHEHQYVTEFNKFNNDVLNEFLFEKNFIITCEFKIEKDFKRDEICMLYGKPGKNIGLSYNSTTKTTAFEFWTTTGEPEDTFNMCTFQTVTEQDIEEGVILSVVRKDNEIILYQNFKKVNNLLFDGEFIEDYKVPGLFIGCSSPECEFEKQRYYCEVDMKHLSIIINTSNINDIRELYNVDMNKILTKTSYNDILCLYDFESANNLGIIYDESKNTNFLEKVPKEFVK
jgi:hypothetical protein